MLNLVVIYVKKVIIMIKNSHFLKQILQSNNKFFFDVWSSITHHDKIYITKWLWNVKVMKKKEALMMNNRVFLNDINELRFQFTWSRR
jgi:hypothetical protein